jgi:hypothetical protein
MLSNILLIIFKIYVKESFFLTIYQLFLNFPQIVYVPTMCWKIIISLSHHDHELSKVQGGELFTAKVSTN